MSMPLPRILAMPFLEYRASTPSHFAIERARVALQAADGPLAFENSTAMARQRQFGAPAACEKDFRPLICSRAMASFCPRIAKAGFAHGRTRRRAATRPPGATEQPATTCVSPQGCDAAAPASQTMPVTTLYFQRRRQPHISRSGAPQRTGFSQPRNMSALILATAQYCLYSLIIRQGELPRRAGLADIADGSASLASLSEFALEVLKHATATAVGASAAYGPRMRASI